MTKSRMGKWMLALLLLSGIQACQWMPKSTGANQAQAAPAPAPGRYADRTTLWQPFGGDLLYNFVNMYNLHIVATPENKNYPYFGWFFGWAADPCNEKFSGCDAIFAARAPKLEGPWEVYAGDDEKTGAAKWDATMNPKLWFAVVSADNKFYDTWHNGDPSVVRVNGLYHMAYSSTGFNKDMIPFGQKGDTDSDISCVMGATSTDGLHWKRTSGPLLIDPRNIGQAPVKPGEYMHPYGLFHRPSLMLEGKVWKIWCDAWDGKDFVALYAENHGDFTNPADWKMVRGLDNPCIIEYPNPEVVKIGRLYYAYGDPSGYGQGWAGREICEAVSLNGRDWALLGYIKPDADVQAQHVPEAFVQKENGQTWIYLNFGGQIKGDYKYDKIRMKRRLVTKEELKRNRALCKSLKPGPVQFTPAPAAGK